MSLHALHKEGRKQLRKQRSYFEATYTGIRNSGMVPGHVISSLFYWILGCMMPMMLVNLENTQRQVGKY